MKQQLKAAGLAVLMSVAAGQANRTGKNQGRRALHAVRPAAVLGQHMRDGFALAAKQLGGKMGGARRKSSSSTTN